MFHRKIASFDGTWIAYRLYGNKEKPWLVLTNGAGCSEHYWTSKLIPTLENDFRLLEWDYRGQYDSGPAPGRDAYRVRDHASDLLAILDAESIDKAVFLGFSLGVQVTLEAYSMRPGVFNSLCFVNGSYEDPLSSMWGTDKLRPLIAGILEFASHFPGLVSLLTRVILGGPLALPLAKLNRFCEKDVPREPFDAYMKKVSRIDPIAYMRILRLMGEHSAAHVLSGITVPTLLIAGDQDTMTPLQKMREMKSAIKGSELIVVPGGRHTLLFSRGDWIGNTLKDFL
ncbi:MAG: alpha/beta fold hydrolase, partial [Deltaproteobacteria bacterium]|nr:alpha/beta fold hydrolase [Deltaproteobacteria bacterium]